METVGEMEESTPTTAGMEEPETKMAAGTDSTRIGKYDGRSEELIDMDNLEVTSEPSDSKEKELEKRKEDGERDEESQKK